MLLICHLIREKVRELEIQLGKLESSSETDNDGVVWPFLVPRKLFNPGAANTTIHPKT